MNWKTWTQLLAALVVVGLCVYIGKLILPVVQTMTPVIAWTLTVVIVVVLISLGLGVPAAIVMGLRALHTHHAVKEIEARKLAVTERGFLQGYISRQEQLLIPQITAHSIEVPGHMHIQEERSSGGADSAPDWRERLAWEKLKLEQDKLQMLAAGRTPALLPAMTKPTMQEVVSAVEANSYQVCLGKNLSGEFIITDLLRKHVKIIGASQMGKSCLVGAILEQMRQTHDPQHLQLAILDLEDMTGTLFDRDPHILRIRQRHEVHRLHARTSAEVASSIILLHGLMLSRYTLMRERGLAYVEALPRVLIYFEEFLYWKRTLSQFVPNAQTQHEAFAAITGIATRGLKVGLHLLVVAQVDYADKEFVDAMAQFVGINVSFAVKPSAARSAGFVSTELLSKNFAARTPGQFVIEIVGGADIGVSPDFDVKAKVKAVSTWRDVGETAQTPREEGDEGYDAERPDAAVVEADGPDMEPLHERPSNVRPFPTLASTQPAEPTQQASEERLKYTLTAKEIDQFIAAYKASGNVDKALAATGTGKGSKYREAARRIIEVYALRKDA